MKRVSKIFLGVIAALLLLTTGCPGPGTDPTDNPTAFVRYHAGNDAYAGYNEIFFDNYTDLLAKSSGLYIYRKTATTDWDRFCYIGAPQNEFFSSLSPVYDPFTDPGTEYSYKIAFYIDSEFRFQDSGVQTITADEGLHEIVCTKPAATYNSTTGEMTFTTLPEFSLSNGSEIPDRYDMGADYVTGMITYVLDNSYGVEQSFLVNWIEDNILDMYELAEIYDFFGTSLHPVCMEYEIEFYANAENGMEGEAWVVAYNYHIDIGDDMPSFSIPETLP